ncbi:SDR family NAD(P)-dependent oxidoreductase [Sediminibacillus halophilus]|uniref:3-oxoacyl-[acyl-carrier protein] reductase n=1 Tax=Sediminibacillus halophilus TaxID=482461 RepID=A0A1G9X2A4_9BACI|nr:SDR family oxidoreductase [Sediminibacillus halophilus]SDM90802.1 3-oxoacyl-[acyl-carrier protein] reductase [Sediminibacillus halophilus]
MGVFASNALQGEHALITGATGGIGYETALAAADMGASLTITGRNEEKLEQLKQTIANKYPRINVLAHRADIGDEQERTNLVASAEQEIGNITLLVNCAGIGGGGLVEELEQEEMEKIMHLNYTVPVLLSKQVYKQMKSSGKGAIVNVSSLSGLRGTHGNTAYSASKFALIGFTHSFSLEAIEHGVRVNAVCPGYVDTTMGRNAIKRKGEKQGRSFEEQLKVTEEGLPSGRITKPEEVANTICYLLTDAAQNIVGESVKISAGSVRR